MALLGKILQALAAAVPAFLAWLERRQAAKSQAATADRVADVRADPGAAWMHKFGAADQQPGDNDPADQAGTEQPQDHG